MFVRTKEISEEDFKNLPKGTLYCRHDDKYELVKLGTIVGNVVDNVVVDELSPLNPYFGIWSFNLVYGSEWVYALNDWSV